MTGQYTSFTGYDQPDRYLRHRNRQLYLDPFTGTELFRQDATFAVRPTW